MITIASWSDNILNAVMLKVKHELLFLLVECHFHKRYYALWLQKYNFYFLEKKEKRDFLKKNIHKYISSSTIPLHQSRWNSNVSLFQEWTYTDFGIEERVLLPNI